MYRFIVLYVCIYVAPWSCEARHFVPLYVPTCSGMTIKLNLNLNLICSIFSALGSWSPCLSPGYKGNISEEIAGDLTSSFHWHYAFRHSKPFVFLSCMKLQAGEITFIQIIFVTQGYPISPYLFKPLFSPSFIAGSSELAKGMCVWVVWLFPPLSRLFPLANTAVCFHCLLTASRVL